MGYNGVGENHGLRNHILHNIWSGIKTRCHNSKRKGWKDYGGRGIVVCDEWINSFLSFYNFCINNGWKEGLEIDRININGNYEPSNCQFITKAENLAIGKQRKRNDNKTGYVGVSFNKLENKYKSGIFINRKQLHLGTFNKLSEAVEARIQAEILYFKEQKTNFHYIK